MGNQFLIFHQVCLDTLHHTLLTQEITEQPKYSLKTPEAALSIVEPKPHSRYSCLVSWGAQEGISAFVMP